MTPPTMSGGDRPPVASRRFKQDEDFLRFITMGAAGSAAIADWLKHAHHHEIIELERGSMGNKIWATKLKQMRLPDLLCLGCGKRCEARAKSKLEISMSDSAAENRSWDVGLRDEDLAIFQRWDGHQVVGTPQCFTVGALRTAHKAKATRLSETKSASEGSERRLIWPATVPDDDGTVVEISDDGRKVKVRFDSLVRRGGRSNRSRDTHTYSLRASRPAYCYLTVDEHFSGGEQFLFGTVEKAIDADLDCSDGWNHVADLDSLDVITRYVAVKAAGIKKDASAIERLTEIAERDPADGDEGLRLRLEAWASLARIEPETWTREVVRVVDDGDAAMALEAVFILSELASDEALTVLEAIAANGTLNSELRAAAVWGFGKTGAGRPDFGLRFISNDDDLIAMHAIAGLSELSEDAIRGVAASLDAGDREAASAITVLSRCGEAGARALLGAVKDEKGNWNEWALAGLGQIDPGIVRQAAGGNLEPELESRLQPIWALTTRHWLKSNTASDPISFLERQTIRHVLPTV